MLANDTRCGHGAEPASIATFDAVSANGGGGGEQRRRHLDLHAGVELQRRGETFSYTIDRRRRLERAATVTVNVAPVNDAPVAVATTLAVTRRHAGDVPAADLLAQRHAMWINTNVQLAIATVTQRHGRHGGVEQRRWHGDLHAERRTSTARRDLQLHDRPTARRLERAATVTVNVAPVNDAPVAVATTLAATVEDTRGDDRRPTCWATTRDVDRREPASIAIVER